MLGFSAISEAPISQATVSSAALGYLSTTLATITASNLLFEGIANVTADSTAATLSLNIDFDAKATSSLTGTESTTTVNDFTSVLGKANFTLNPATAAFTSGQLVGTGLANFIIPSTASIFSVNDFADVSAEANRTLTSTSASFTSGQLISFGLANFTVPSITATFSLDIDFDAQANLSITSALVTTAVNDFADVKAEANNTLSNVTSNISAEDIIVKGAANIISNGVSATSVTDTLSFDAKANLTVASIPNNITINNFADVKAKANITIPSATFTGLVTAFEEVKGEATTTLEATLLSSFTNIGTPTAVIFDYGPYAEQYSKSRVLYILRQKPHGTELRSANSPSLTTSNVVHVQVEERSVYIGRSSTNNTVYIAA